MLSRATLRVRRPILTRGIVLTPHLRDSAGCGTDSLVTRKRTALDVASIIRAMPLTRDLWAPFILLGVVDKPSQPMNRDLMRAGGTCLSVLPNH
jgi:hypothetical protein